MTYLETMEAIFGKKTIEKLSDGELIDLTQKEWNMIMAWLREHEGQITGYFPISSVSRADLESEHFDASNVSDDTMRELASKMGDAYTGNDVFWIDLNIIADHLKIPKRKQS